MVFLKQLVFWIGRFMRFRIWMIGYRNFEPTTQYFCPATDRQEYWRIQMFEYMIVLFSLFVSKEKIDQVVSAFLS